MRAQEARPQAATHRRTGLASYSPPSVAASMRDRRELPYEILP